MQKYFEYKLLIYILIIILVSNLMKCGYRYFFTKRNYISFRKKQCYMQYSQKSCIKTNTDNNHKIIER